MPRVGNQSETPVFHGTLQEPAQDNGPIYGTDAWRILQGQPTAGNPTPAPRTNPLPGTMDQLSGTFNANATPAPRGTTGSQLAGTGGLSGRGAAAVQNMQANVTAVPSAATPSANPYDPPPPAQPTSPYGQNPFVTNPTQSNPLGGTTALNPVYWATQDSAQQVASRYGGTVFTQSPYAGGSGFSGNQPQYMVRLPNGAVINPADVADLYRHGYSQEYINRGLATLGLPADAATAGTQATLAGQPPTASAQVTATTPISSIGAVQPTGFPYTAPTSTPGPVSYAPLTPTPATPTPAASPDASGLMALLSLLSGFGGLNQGSAAVPSASAAPDWLPLLLSVLGGQGGGDLYSRNRRPRYPLFP